LGVIGDFLARPNILPILDTKVMGTMTKDEVLSELEKMGSPTTKKILVNHGAREPLFGVKVGDMKKIVKKTKKDHELSMALYATGNYDAMYFAGLIADEKKISKKDLESWVAKSYGGISEYVVPWIASESPHGWELGMKWIESPKENIAAAGWTSLANVVTLLPDDKLDIKTIEKLLARVKKEVHTAPNRVRYAMNCFLISVGAYVASLTASAKQIAKGIGPVTVVMEGTACKVPSAFDYITKIETMGRIGKKKKQARC
jgi:3-methyladenine DNA glycosylase AlkD